MPMLTFAISVIVYRLAEMRFLSKAYDTRGAGAEEADGTGKLTGTW